MNATLSPRSRRGFLGSLAACLTAAMAKGPVEPLQLAASNPPDRFPATPPLTPEDAALNRLLLVSYQAVLVTAKAGLKAHEDCAGCELCTDATTAYWNAERWNAVIESETLPTDACRLDVGFRLMRDACPGKFADSDADQRIRRLIATALACACQATLRALDLHCSCNGCFMCYDGEPILNTARILLDLTVCDLDIDSHLHVYKLFGVDFGHGRGPTIDDVNLPMAVLERIAIQAGRESRA